MEVIKIGETVPDVVFKFMGPEGLTDIKSSELFRGKRIAAFGLPGAYTPVCSAKHLPDFVAEADELMKKQIDGIVCISVNDPFVMKAWGDDHGTENKIHMMSDHQGEFTRSIGLALDLSHFGCAPIHVGFLPLVFFPPTACRIKTYFLSSLLGRSLSPNLR